MRLAVLVDKELRQLLRDERAMGIIIAMSILVPIALGTAYSGRLGHMPIAVCNLDGSRVSWLLADALRRSGDFDIKYYVSTPLDARVLVEERRVFGAVIIPRGFGDALMRGERTYIIVVSDRSNVYLSSALESAINSIASRMNLEIAGGGVETIVETVYGPRLRNVDIILSPVLGVTIMLVGSGLMSVSVAKEREKGTIEQLMMTPLNVWELVFGKFIAYTVVVSIDVVVTILIITSMFGAVVRGGIPSLLAISFLFTVGSIALGLFLSSVSSNQLQAQQAVILVYIPSMLFSGIFIPVELSGALVKTISYYDPMYRFINAAKLITLNGYSIAGVWSDVLFLTVFMVVMFILSVISLKVKVM